MRLHERLRQGDWPRTPQEANSYNLAPMPLTEAGRLHAPNESSVCLYPLPLRTPRRRMSDGESIWRDPTFDPNGIDWDHSVVIGDFGLGSDSPPSSSTTDAVPPTPGCYA